MTYVDALQSALSGEHAALFVVGYLGAQTSASAQPALSAALREAFETHRGRRDTLEMLVRDADGTPVAAAPSYELPDVAGDPAQITMRALGVEQSCGVTYGFLVANSVEAQRRWALDALLDCALRELVFGGTPRRNPGR